MYLVGVNRLLPSKSQQLAGSDEDQYVLERIGQRHFCLGGFKDILHPLQRFKAHQIAPGDLLRVY